MMIEICECETFCQDSEKCRYLKFIRNLLDEQKDLPPEFKDISAEEYWEMLA